MSPGPTWKFTSQIRTLKISLLLRLGTDTKLLLSRSHYWGLALPLLETQQPQLLTARYSGYCPWNLSSERILCGPCGSKPWAVNSWTSVASDWPHALWIAVRKGGKVGLCHLRILWQGCLSLVTWDSLYMQESNFNTGRRRPSHSRQKRIKDLYTILELAKREEKETTFIKYLSSKWPFDLISTVIFKADMTAFHVQGEILKLRKKTQW